jgi:hypothetical protein
MGMTGQRGGASFKGRGPKGYKRSDERVREDICDRLTQHDEIDAGDIEVNVANGEVTLTGTVESRNAKHMIENVIEAIPGVHDIHNQLRVKKAGQDQGASDDKGAHDKSTMGQQHAQQQQHGQSGQSTAMTTSPQSQPGAQGKTDVGRTEGKSEQKGQEANKTQGGENSRRNATS